MANGRDKRGTERRQLGMAKMICEDFASLLLNEKVQISADGFDALEDVLQRNAFYERANRLVEWACALGTGALVEFLDADGQPTIDYVRGNMVYPLEWRGDEITACAFGSRVKLGKQLGYYVQIHERTPAGYVLRNVYLDEQGRELPTPDGVQPESIPSPVPLFQVIRPNTINAIEPDCPMGISVYGMAIEQLKAIDIVYDSYVNEFVLGKKRMYVPQSLASLAMEDSGAITPRFDPNDALIYVYEQSEDGKSELKPVDMTIRAGEHEQGLQRMIDLLSKKCGLGTGRYRFDGAGVKTATEVISENSDLYQSIKRHEKPLARALRGMVSALDWLCGGSGEIDTTVSFDDSIFEDTGATMERNITLVTAGLKSKLRAIMEIDHCSEEEARRRLTEIAQESATDVPAVQELFGGDGE